MWLIKNYNSHCYNYLGRTFEEKEISFRLGIKILAELILYCIHKLSNIHYGRHQKTLFLFWSHFLLKLSVLQGLFFYKFLVEFYFS